MEGRHSLRRPAPSRASGLLLTLATVCGLWFGISAPDVSPVTPGAVPGIEVVGPPGPGAGVAP